MIIAWFQGINVELIKNMAAAQKANGLTTRTTHTTLATLTILLLINDDARIYHSNARPI